ncbi:potassium transporter Kup [Roseateles koreensis]|uniref:Probable potassium transport system protein Kup n=1 Tax=Roseateles koreensis TaxID=2987526 RepID=A0ABT5KPU0_9BURK|nr:potassium transporter Kup [Roseateles koreensis]
MSSEKSVRSPSALAALTLGALGVVYGDIGTSPLYALKEVFNAGHVPLTPENIIGILSLVFWTLTIVVSLKYVALIMRASNNGEGGTMALLALAGQTVSGRPRLKLALLLMGIMGAAMFYGDGVITPAISVLSAIEGLELVTPAFQPYVVPITLGILLGLYAIQKHGTGAMGVMFGPITLVWFFVIAYFGLIWILREPAVLAAINPVHALSFALTHGHVTLIVLGAVFLSVTGAEALYADMGHFGPTPIRLAWFLLVFPALVMNYFGQGALLLAQPAAVENPFFRMVPEAFLLPMVGLAAMATVIASQATISGTFSVTKQAIQLGYLPRMRVIHTSIKETGQIYIPAVNWMQFGAIIAAVALFGSSSAMATAYGIAVTATMVLTTLMTFFVIRYLWKYPAWLCWSATAFFLSIELVFLSSNILKVFSGGWFTLAIAAAVFTVMLTWKQGRRLLAAKLREDAIDLRSFLEAVFISPPHRVVGSAVFLSAEPGMTPNALLHNLKHNKVLHAQNVFVTVKHHEVPWIDPEQRVRIEDLGHHCWQVSLNFGFKDEPDVPQALTLLKPHGVVLDDMETSYFLSRDIVIPTIGSGMALWREKLFASMHRNASAAADFLHLPANRIVELGSKVEI